MASNDSDSGAGMPPLHSTGKGTGLYRSSASER
jgi:hypothetical protein